MSSRRKKIWISLPVMLATAVLLPATAGANPLLSGYGGPGQGDQAILGATLLNTSGGGGGSSSSSSASSAESSAALTVQPGATKGQAKPAAHPRRHGTARGSGRSQMKAASSETVPGGGPVRDLAATGSDSGGTLGLSGGDILYLLLALAALALTGGLTRQLTRRPH